MTREFVGGPMDGTQIPLDDDDLTDEIHIDMINLNGAVTVHVYSEDEKTGNYKYDGEFPPEDLYEEEEDEDE